MIINDIITYLEGIIPLDYQESYDNSGLQVGQKQQPLKGALICLDVTEEVIEEAIQEGCNLIISHHPIIFKGLKKLTGQNYVARIVELAIKNDIAIYAAHTNLDSMDFGVSKHIADKIGLTRCNILSPKKNSLKKLVTFCPVEHADKVRNAIFEAGAGHIGNYSHCSFNSQGNGTFKAGKNTNPFVGEQEELHTEPEVKIEVIFPIHKSREVIRQLIQSHPYEEVAYDIYPLENVYSKVGLGMMGELETEMHPEEFLSLLKEKLQLKVIKHTELLSKPIKKVALCGGSGSFLIHTAIAQQADIYITGDIKYHDFFDADGKIILVDIGHYESEKFTKELLKTLITKKFPNFAPVISKVNTNPIYYR
ncbi:MAG: Nif3-like dinuclear metal center hexameric protein [Bacteroidetes bacterium]|nr:MAG: Nif3-like dinuclear metal center hexameric protein [Bacteroidota bacterium]